MAQSGYTPILIYASGTATNVPLAANLTSSASGAELALNYVDGKLFYKDNAGVVQTLATKSSTSGVFTSVTDSGLTSGRVTYAGTGGLLQDSANLTFNGTTLTAAGFSGPISGVVTSTSITDSGLTSGRVTYATTGGLLTDSANLQFDGNNLGIGVTPSAWYSTWRACEFIGGGSLASGPSQYAIWLSSNAYLNTSGNWTYKASTYAYQILLDANNGAIKFNTAPTGTAGGAVTFTSAMTLNASGNLGIGYTSPQARLDVRAANIAVGVTALATAQGQSFVGTTDGWGQDIGGTLALGGAQNSGTLTQTFASISGRRESSLGYIYTGYMQFAVSDGANMVERMRIDSSGNLGLGVTPSAWGTYKGLQVGGSAALWGPASTGAEAYLNANTYYNGSNRIYISTNSATEYSQAAGVHSWKTAVSGTAGTAITFTTAMTLDTAGNLGIGTTSPSSYGKFVVNGSSNILNGNFLYMWSSGNTAAPGMYAPGDAFAWKNSAGTTEWMRINSTGLGIGTSSPNYKIDLGFTDTSIGWYLNSTYSGSIAYTTASRSMTIGVRSADAVDFIAFKTGTDFSEKMRLTSLGNVGIGTTSPAALLDLGGNTASTVQQIFGRGVTDSSFTVRYTNGASGSAAFTGTLGLDYANGTWADMAAIKFYRNSTAGELAFFASASGASGTERMRLTSTGLGIGITSPASRLQVVDSSGIGGTVTIGTDQAGVDGGTCTVNMIGSNNYIQGSHRNLASPVARINLFPSNLGTNAEGVISFSTRNSGGTLSEGMRLDSSGNLLMGTTAGYANSYSIALLAPSGYGIVNHPSGASSGSSYLAFGYNASPIGSISQSGTTAVLYNVTSDQRLKENIIDAPEFGSVIDSIKVRSFDWKSDNSHQRAGFIAQELVTVAPEAVHQPIDSEEMMAVDYSKLVPMLVKEIQSLRARVAQLETKGV